MKETFISLGLVVFPLVGALAVFGLLRDRGARALVAGCVSAVAGVVAVFLLIAVLVVAGGV